MEVLKALQFSYQQMEPRCVAPARGQFPEGGASLPGLCIPHWRGGSGGVRVIGLTLLGVGFRLARAPVSRLVIQIPAVRRRGNASRFRDEEGTCGRLMLMCETHNHF